MASSSQRSRGPGVAARRYPIMALERRNDETNDRVKALAETALGCVAPGPFFGSNQGAQVGVKNERKSVKEAPANVARARAPSSNVHGPKPLTAMIHRVRAKVDQGRNRAEMGSVPNNVRYDSAPDFASNLEVGSVPYVQRYQSVSNHANYVEGRPISNNYHSTSECSHQNYAGSGMQNNGGEANHIGARSVLNPEAHDFVPIYAENAPFSATINASAGDATTLTTAHCRRISHIRSSTHEVPIYGQGMVYNPNTQSYEGLSHGMVYTPMTKQFEGPGNGSNLPPSLAHVTGTAPDIPNLDTEAHEHMATMALKSPATNIEHIQPPLAIEDNGMDNPSAYNFGSRPRRIRLQGKYCRCQSKWIADMDHVCSAFCSLLKECNPFASLHPRVQYVYGRGAVLMGAQPGDYSGCVLVAEGFSLWSVK